MKQVIPTEALNQPAYKSDPRRLIGHRDCQHCGTRFPVAKKYPKQRFCSRGCGFKAVNPPDFNARVAKATVAARAAKQRGGGERKTYMKLNGRHAHRVIAELIIGRPLRRGEVVHHIDGNIRNNDPTNLQVLSSQADHARVHFTGIRQSAEHVRKRVEGRMKSRRGEAA
jgi:hypothetical protein